ncbi:hypothetical protein EX30DRAFT_343303 [Ascodesmis nigricans]|uniref:Uncharacterized protein n=1 Tax=Ascodesmis nigricans TaxID=341454 RepID=A0A4S2MMZ0_9PEZI|nr:hypothetical protein EX30DRAFT_343303 [Ascodesmis nigricans]
MATAPFRTNNLKTDISSPSHTAYFGSEANVLQPAGPNHPMFLTSRFVFVILGGIFYGDVNALAVSGVMSNGLM